MEYLDEDDVLCIRRRLAVTEMAGRDFGVTDPVNQGNFSSAVARQHAGYGKHRKYKTLPEVAATLFYGLALNHAFENGNKRTALISMLTLLQKNKHVLVDATEDDLYEFATQVAAHTFLVRRNERTPDSEVSAIAAWIKERARTLQLGDRMMRFRELKAQLQELGCEIGKPDRSFIKFYRYTPEGTHTVSIGYDRADFEVPVDQVKRVRRALHLDEVNGVDSAAFYDLETSVDTFVNRYRHLLDRLAET